MDREETQNFNLSHRMYRMQLTKAKKSRNALSFLDPTPKQPNPSIVELQTLPLLLSLNSLKEKY